MSEAKEFKKLLGATFVSQTGSHFLTLALAAFVFISSGSPTQSALIFVVSFLPSILVSAELGHWVDKKISRWLFARNELISIFATFLCGFCIAYHLPLVFLCIILGLRSLFTFVSRAAATKWLKLISPPALQTGRIKLFYLSFFLSTAFSGLLASLVLAHASIWTIVSLDALSFLLGAGLIGMLKELPLPETIVEPAQETFKPKLSETLSAIFSMPAVCVSFLIVCFSQALFQGAYSGLISFLPIQQFKLGLGGVGSFQLAASLGITGGFLINWFLPKMLCEKNGNLFPRRAASVAVVGVGALGIAVSTTLASTSIAAFFCLNFAYECIWLYHNSEFFRASPKAHAARYQFTLSACASFLMATFTLGFSAGIEYLGLIPGTIIVVVSGFVLILFSTLWMRRTPTMIALRRPIP